MAIGARTCVASLVLLAACSGDISEPVTSRRDPEALAPGPASTPSADPAAPAAVSGMAPSGGASAPANANLTGRTGPRRLTNVEYDNTIHDLLGSEQKLAAGFVSEEASGFDNVASALDVTPSQYESYYNAAETLAAEFFANAKQRDANLGCTPSGDEGGACLDGFLQDFGTRVFRRPLTASERTSLEAAYGRAHALGETELASAQHVLVAMLASAQFLYRSEPADLTAAANTARPLDGYELASRLSYFLWSTLPDAELFRVAADRSLLQTDVLEKQVARMLGDPRAQAFVENFAGQWLGMRALTQHEVLSDVYPDFDPPLRAAMLQELESYVGEFLFANRPLDEFLRSEIHFVDKRLAAHYGIAAPSQSGFARVDKAIGDRRGFIGLASFLTVTSFAQRTSPTLRAKWILEQLLCSPVPPPPANVVASLEGENKASADAIDNVRARLEQHRSNPACSGCHDLMDPLGLALESFDGIGKSRTKYDNGDAIDTHGVLPDGRKVDGPVALANVLANDPGFLRCITQKLLTYALGRSVDAEIALIDDTLASFESSGTLRALIESIVLSSAFRQQLNAGGTP
jgi:Protein of unknown function (DUF1592)/Protein of unknown function (DUF1588)/Protein of unknown function (DUF1587)/Protein of unknown function (DUF1595)/Protein of unknown function (DUF1585)